MVIIIHIAYDASSIDINSPLQEVSKGIHVSIVSSSYERSKPILGREK